MSRRAAAAREATGTMLAALLAALAATAGALTAAGIPVRQGLSLMLEGAGGQPGAVPASLLHATPILLVGLGVSLALRAGFWNLGAAGQVAAGAMAATAAAGLEAATMPVLLMAGAVGGAAAVAMPVLLRVRAGTDEALTTLLLAAAIASLAPSWPTRQAASILIDPVSGAVLAMMLGAALWLATLGTTVGLMLRATGANPHAARRAGLPVDAVMGMAAMASGALAGLAGAMLSASPHEVAISNHAHAGVAVALMARRWPPAVLPAALSAGAAVAGTDHMATTFDRPAPLGELVVAAALIGALAGGALARGRR